MNHYEHEKLVSDHVAGIVCAVQDETPHDQLAFYRGLVCELAELILAHEKDHPPSPLQSRDCG